VLICCRLLAQGDVFGASISDTLGMRDLLAGLLRDAARSTAISESAVYFRVDKMLPASSSSLLVDPEQTAMTLKVHRLSKQCMPF
jgi:hypothetical protein